MSKKTPLYDWHVQNGAKIVDFSGYLMPVSYSGVLKEHEAVRLNCGLFDISHMGEIFIEGKTAEAFIQFLTTNDVKKLADGTAQYSLILNEQGYAIDDIMVYRLNAEKFFFCVNAANIDKDFKWIQSKAFGGVEIRNESDQWGMIALQGPNSAKVLKNIDIEIEAMSRFSIGSYSFRRHTILISRTGYTGEEGYEIFVKQPGLVALWQALIQAGQKAGIQPIGLGARDTLRLEKGYVLYGHELNESIYPLEAHLGWVIKFQKGDFIGREALQKVKKQGLSRTTKAIIFEEPGIPREGMRVYDQEKQQSIGTVLSGTLSPTLKKGIATLLVEEDRIPKDGTIYIDIRGKMKKAKIHSLPLV